MSDSTGLTLAERNVNKEADRKGARVLETVEKGIGLIDFEEAMKETEQARRGDFDPTLDGLYVQLALIDLPVGTVDHAPEFIPSQDRQVRGPGEALAKLKKVGQRLFLAYSAALHKFVCEKGNDDLRSKLITAITGGTGASLLTTLFISIGVPAVAAPVAAAVLLVIFINPTTQTLCSIWSESLAGMPA